MIGGGAAGYFLAGVAARGAGDLANVTILEASARVLQKVRISGGGRCNVTSGLHHSDPAAFAANYPRGSRAMVGVLSRYGAADVMHFFEKAGVPLKREKSGKIFPVSDRSEDVCGALERSVEEAGVVVRRGARVSDLRPRDGGGFVLQIAGGEMQADIIAVTTGSAPVALKWARALGHSPVPQMPSLFSFKTRHPLIDGLAGVSVSDASVHLKPPPGRGRRTPGLSQRGALLVTHWGVSGPAVLALSAFGARVLASDGYTAGCFVDWIPSLSREQKMDVLRRSRGTQAQRGLLGNNPFRESIPKRLWQAVVGQCGREMGVKVEGMTWGSVSNKLLSRVAEALQITVLPVTGRGEFKDEFVTAGGVPLKEVDVKTFESKIVEGLYFAGEVLDVDGSSYCYSEFSMG